MADIKTRDVTRGHIKTLDRATSSMYHIKEADVRIKSAEPYREKETDSGDSYAADTMMHYAGDSTVFATKAGVELAQRTIQQKSITENEIIERPVQPGSSAISDIAEHFCAEGRSVITGPEAVNDREKRVQQAFREYGAKTIRKRNARTKQTDLETARNTEESRRSDRIKNAVSNKGVTVRRRSGRIINTARNGAQVTIDHRQIARRQTAIRNIVSRNERGGIRNIIAVITGRSRGSGGAAARSAHMLKISLQQAKTLTTAIYSSVSATVAVVILVVFFGTIIAMPGDSTSENYAFDLYDIGPGDTAIVKVAEAQLGNVGGDKFWKWYGFTSHVHWCATFVSWCGNECGYIKAGIIPKFAVVGNGADWFKARHRWSGRNYSPRAGDIIFFDYERDGVLDHVRHCEKLRWKNCDHHRRQQRECLQKLDIHPWSQFYCRLRYF